MTEKKHWGHVLNDENCSVPFLESWGEINRLRQMEHPMKIITSGEERVRTSKKALFAGKWRFTERVSWWDNYFENTPVIVGHYWRRIKNPMKKSEESIFNGINPFAFFGVNKNVFCVDYSIGLKYLQRQEGKEDGLHLGALRWPEQLVVLENGEVISIVGKR